MPAVILMGNTFPMGILSNELIGFTLRFRQLMSDEDIDAILCQGELFNTIHNPVLSRLVESVLESHRVEVPQAKRIQKTSFSHGEVILMAHYQGPPIPEGSTKVPEGGILEWWAIMSPSD